MKIATALCIAAITATSILSTASAQDSDIVQGWLTRIKAPNWGACFGKIYKQNGTFTYFGFGFKSAVYIEGQTSCAMSPPQYLPARPQVTVSPLLGQSSDNSVAPAPKYYIQLVSNLKGTCKDSTDLKTCGTRDVVRVCSESYVDGTTGAICGGDVGPNRCEVCLSGKEVPPKAS